MKKRLDVGGDAGRKKKQRWCMEDDLLLWSRAKDASVNYEEVAGDMGKSHSEVRKRTNELTKKRVVSKWTMEEDDVLRKLTADQRANHGVLNKVAQKLKKAKTECGQRYDWLVAEEEKRRRQYQDYTVKKAEEDRAREVEAEVEHSVKLVDYSSDEE